MRKQFTSLLLIFSSIIFFVQGALQEKALIIQDPTGIQKRITYSGDIAVKDLKQKVADEFSLEPNKFDLKTITNITFEEGKNVEGYLRRGRGTPIIYIKYK